MAGRYSSVVELTSRNIRGLFSNLAAALRGCKDVILLQEVDLAECHVADITAQAASAGYSCEFGLTTKLDQYLREYGRRAAILVKSPAIPKDLSEELDDGNVRYLRNSGRWVERLIPAGDGMQYIVASLYGISGASGSTQKYIDNENLLSVAFVRMAQMQDAPYFSEFDASINLADSNMIKSAIEAEIAYDICKE